MLLHRLLLDILQAMASDTDIGEITVALKQLTGTIEDLLNYGRTTLQDSSGFVEEFVDSKIGKLFGFVTAYQKCLTRLKVKTKHEFEKILHTHARNREVRELSTELLDLEQEWDIFLSDVDKILASDCSDTVQLGQTGPIHDNLIDVRTDQNTCLENYLGDKSLVLVLLRHFA